MRSAFTLALASLFFVASFGASMAQVAQAGGDFTFRSVKPPQPGEKRRLVQIDPEAEVFRITPGDTPRRPGDPRPAAAFVVPEVPQTPVNDDMSWYWDAVSPRLGENPGLRFQQAVDMVGRGGSRISAPRLQTLRTIAERHGIEILTGTLGTNVSPALVLSVIAVESAGRVDAVSHAGAEGLMQLMPATARRFGVADSMVSADNIRGGATYLDWLLKEFGGDPVMALAGYNAGEGAVARHGGVPPYSETRAYVPKVLAAWQMAKTLCVTPPELVTDGCVFGGGVLSARAAGN